MKPNLKSHSNFCTFPLHLETSLSHIEKLKYAFKTWLKILKTRITKIKEVMCSLNFSSAMRTVLKLRRVFKMVLPPSLVNLYHYNSVASLIINSSTLPYEDQLTCLCGMKCNGFVQSINCSMFHQCDICSF